MLLDRLLWLYLIESRLAHWVRSHIIESRHFQGCTRMEHCTTQPLIVELLVISVMTQSAASVHPMTAPLCLGELNYLYYRRHHPFSCANYSQRNGRCSKKQGHPCRPQLAIYQVDLLNSYIVPVIILTSSTTLISVSLDQCMLSKAVIVSVSDKYGIPFVSIVS